MEEIDRLPERFEEQFRRTAGTLEIAASETTASYLLARHLKAFRQAHPDTEITVNVASGTQCVEWLREYTVDVALTAMDIVDEDLEFHTLTRSQYVAIAPMGHPLARHIRLDVQELAGYAHITHRHGSYIRELGEMYLRQHGIAPDVAVEVDGWEAIKECVEAGIGIAVVPTLCLTERDNVCRVRLDGAPPPRRYGFSVRRNGRLPLAARQLVETMKSGHGKQTREWQPVAPRTATTSSGAWAITAD